MSRTLPLLFAISLVLSGSACVASDGAPQDLAETSAESSDAAGDQLTAASSDDDIAKSERFNTWLAEQCPDGAGVQRVDEKTGDAVTMSCKEVRATLMEHETARGEVLHLYRATVLGVTTEDGERIGEIGQRWSPLGLACGLVALGVGLAYNWPNRLGGEKHGCKSPKLGKKDQDDCELLGTGFSAVIGIACAFM